MSWVVKERHIDSVTCANRIAKILVLLQQQQKYFKSVVFIFSYFINTKRPNCCGLARKQCCFKRLRLAGGLIGSLVGCVAER